MIYRSLKDVTFAIMNEFDDQPAHPTERSRYLRKLVRTYSDALRNPPEGIIGVGAITYAEDMLVKAQLDPAENV